MASQSRFAGLPQALKACGKSSTARPPRPASSRGSAAAPAPTKPKAAAPAKHQAKPAAKISDEQLRLNMRSFAVLSQPNAEGKGRAVMAMLNADAAMTVPQAIARLDALPFDDPKRETAAKAKRSSDAWDAAYASLFPTTGNAPEASDSASPATTAKPSTREAEISAMWDRAYASVFGTAQASTSDSPQSESKPQSASDMWDRVYADMFPSKSN